jgi:hypothetical protein
MKKDLIIKLSIAIGVVIFGYSIFWFFKAGQVEKQLNKFISENSANISVAELSVSGFPIAQKVSVTDLKFSLPTSLFSKKQVLVKSLEAKSSIFSSEFTLSSIGQVSVNDIEKGSMTIEFSKEPEVNFVVASSGIVKFNYQDMGYRILDNEKNIFYSAAKSTIDIQANNNDAQKTIFKIVGNIAEIQGFNVIDIYKSSLEKKIIEGIKTEQIVMGSSPNPEAENLIKVEEAKSSSDIKSESKTTDVANKGQAVANTVNPSANPNAPNDQANNPDPNSANANNPQLATDPNKLSPAIASQQVPSTIADSNIVKSNLVIDAEYEVASNQQLAIPSEPNQTQEVSIQSNKIIKINNIEFSNPLYKLLINGQLTIMADDNLPSGGISIKIENVDNLVNHLVTELGQMANQTKASNPESPSNDNSSVDVALQDSYKNFLRRIAINLPAVNREISAKNPVSKEKIAQFDVRREKNLDFIINEVSIHEILGKF